MGKAVEIEQNLNNNISLDRGLSEYTPNHTQNSLKK